MKKFFGALAISIVLLTGVVAIALPIDKAMNMCDGVCKEVYGFPTEGYYKCMNDCLKALGWPGAVSPG